MLKKITATERVGAANHVFTRQIHVASWNPETGAVYDTAPNPHHIGYIRQDAQSWYALDEDYWLKGRAKDLTSACKLLV